MMPSWGKKKLFMSISYRESFSYTKTINRYIYSIAIQHMGGENKTNSVFAKWKRNKLVRGEKLFSNFRQDFTINKEM